MLSNDPSYTLNLPEVAQYSISLAHNIHLQSDWYNSIVKGNTRQTLKSKGKSILIVEACAYSLFEELLTWRIFWWLSHVRMDKKILRIVSYVYLTSLIIYKSSLLGIFQAVIYIQATHARESSATREVCCSSTIRSFYGISLRTMIQWSLQGKILIIMSVPAHSKN